MTHPFKKIIGLLALFLLISVSAILSTPTQTIAASGGINSSYTLLEPLPCVNGTTPDTQTPNCVNGKVATFEVDYYIKYAFRLAIALAAFAAVVMFTYGGFEYMMSETSVTNQSEAKSRMKNAVLGLLAVLGSYVILNTIDPRLVNVNTTIKPLDIKAPPSSLIFNDLSESLGQGARETMDKVTIAAASTSEINSHLSALYSDLENATSSNTSQIELEIEQLINQKNLIAANTARDVAIQIMKGRLAVSQNNLDEYNANMARVNTAYYDAVKILTDSNHPEMIPLVEAQRNYSGTFLSNKNDVQKVIDAASIKVRVTSYVGEQGYDTEGQRQAAINNIRTAAINQITSRTNAQIAATTDPTLKALYQTNLAQSVDYLKGIK